MPTQLDDPYPLEIRSDSDRLKLCTQQDVHVTAQPNPAPLSLSKNESSATLPVNHYLFDKSASLSGPQSAPATSDRWQQSR